MLLAAAECVGAGTRDGGLVADSREAVNVAVTDALKNGDDILCLSGGVSMGDSDFVKVTCYARVAVFLSTAY
jgi:molybdopterin biosynthesis enzyme